MTNTESTTYTHAVWAPFVWGCGNSYNEAVANARKYGRFNRRNDYHRVISFTRPIKSFSADAMQWFCEWADEQGEFTFIDINDKEQS